MIFIASCISTVYSHEDAAPRCYGAPHPQHDGDVAAQPAEEALGQVLARRHEDEVLVGDRGVVAGVLIMIISLMSLSQHCIASKMSYKPILSEV